MNKDFIEKINSAGLEGIKKAELQKILGKKCDNILQNLIESEQIFIEKKGKTNFVWTRDNYLSYLSQNDPKFNIFIKLVARKDHSISSNENGNLEKVIPKVSHRNITDPDHDFKVEFDRRLTESSTSIGWAPFSEIRKKICKSTKITEEHFYSMATDLVEKYRENYEVSSGGQEGIMMRGLVHGYVRTV